VEAPLVNQKGGVRFAPSPTGRFHVGNLRTAWISREWARALGMPWVVRFEDIDQPRVLSGAQESQLEDMAALGLQPDQIVVQSERRERHWELFLRAVRQGAVYPCFCSRKEVREALEASASAPHQKPASYSGHCRGIATVTHDHDLTSLGWRFSIPEDPSGRSDVIVARSDSKLDGDGLPDKASFVPAYHWACGIDDRDGGYDLLVRAFDLAEAAQVQRAVGSWMDGPGSAMPAIFHTSLVVSNDGHRLEKRTEGVTLPELARLGIDASALLALFRRSFQLEPSQFSAARIFGEALLTIKLQDLGLPG
jgi:glutamyl-tRNA synthetase